MPLGRKLAVEFVGTFFLVFTAGMATNPKIGAGTLAPLAIGAVLMVMAFAGGYISGGHLNPAVSTAVLVRGRMATNEWMPYVVSQLLAASLVGLLARGLNGGESVDATASTWKMLPTEKVSGAIEAARASG